MYCPKCGSEAIDEAKFCRACGVNLRTISLVVKSHDLIAAALPGNNQNNPATQNLNRNLVAIGFVVMFIGLVTTIFFGSLNIDKLAGIGAAVLIAGAGLLAYPWLPAAVDAIQCKASGRKPSKSSIPSKSAALTAGAMRSKLTTGPLKLNAMPPSITEHTTFKLDENRRRERLAQKNHA